MTAYYTVVLEIYCDDHDDDPRMWPFDELLAPPQGEAARFVKYIHGVKEARGDDGSD